MHQGKWISCVCALTLSVSLLVLPVPAGAAEKNEAHVANIQSGGLGKLLHFGKVPVNMSVQGLYNLERPRYQADWTVRYSVQFLFPKS